MAQEPISEAHAAQILAGTEGRLAGHSFEERLVEQIKVLGEQPLRPSKAQDHLVIGQPALELVSFIARDRGIGEVQTVEAWWLGGLATHGAGDRRIGDTGIEVERSKSDVVVRLAHARGREIVGVSVKTCNKSTPTNAQLYFTTATAFSALLRTNGVPVGAAAERAMKMFCGDPGYRPADEALSATRTSDPSRWFWEELPPDGRGEWETTLSERQEDVTRILLQKAYPGDPIEPTYLMHQMIAPTDDGYPLAIYSIDQVIEYSRAHAGFELREYRIYKGTWKHDTAVHLAPRFGFIQFQRAGNKVHPTQLQFNLKAGYFRGTPPSPLLT